MTFKTIRFYLFIAASALFQSSCNEGEWLDISNNKALIIPSAPEDFQAILDNELIMNQSYPVIGQMGADNGFIPQSAFISLAGLEKQAYIWSADVYEGRNAVTDWNQPYKIIECSNIVLDGLNKTGSKDADGQGVNSIKGAALFFRAFAFYNLAQLFCKPYDGASAAADPGIPLRLSSDVNVRVPRATVKETYERILQDLQLAESLLPVSAPYVTRPSRAAACALLAKVYLLMQDYEKALEYAGKTLEINASLLDFNTLSTAASSPFPAVTNGATPNTEILFYARCIVYNSMRARGSIAKIDTALYKAYADADLRKAIFYAASGNYRVFKGTYSGGSITALFGGLATNEIYMIQAECSARLNDVPNALASLNALLQKRYRPGFVPLTAGSAEEALRLIVTERRKELPQTAQVRWEDLRRLNRDPRFALTLKRQIGNEGFSLPPEDPRYVLPIPDYELALNPMPQNER